MEGGSKMTREEQIKKQANIYIGHPQDLEEDICITNMRNDFIEGVKWADKHPKEGLVSIDKVCDWLLKGGYFVNNTETINDFKKAMEE